MRTALPVLLLIVAARPAAAAERAGVAMPDAITVGPKTLVLNGIGLRERTIFKVNVYVAGLYLERRSRSAEEIIRSEQVKRLDVVLLRDVDRDDLMEVFREGLERNGAAMGRLAARIDRFASCLSDLKEGDKLTLLYVPGAGLTVILRGKVRGTIPGADFAGSLLSIWLGTKPADQTLKHQLLGG